MEIEQITEIIQNLGFPTFVAIYLLVFATRITTKLTNLVDKLTEILLKIDQNAYEIREELKKKRTIATFFQENTKEENLDFDIKPLLLQSEEVLKKLKIISSLLNEETNYKK